MSFDLDSNFDLVKIARDPIHGTCIALRISEGQELLLQHQSTLGSFFNCGYSFWVFEDRTSRKPLAKLSFFEGNWWKLFEEGRVKVLSFYTFPQVGTIDKVCFLVNLIRALRVRGIKSLPAKDSILYEALEASYLKLEESRETDRVRCDFRLGGDGSFNIPDKHRWPDWYNVWQGFDFVTKEYQLVKVEPMKVYYQHLVTITVTPRLARQSLQKAIGGPELWDELAKVFIEKTTALSEMNQGRN